MNVAARQEKEKNENTKTGKRKEGREKTSERLKRGCLLPFCGRSEANTAKNGLCERSDRGN